MNHADHSGDAGQLRGLFAGGRHKNGIEQSLRGGDHPHLSARQFRQHTALRRADSLKMGLRHGAMKRGAGLHLAGYRRVLEDQRIVRRPAGRLAERREGKQYQDERHMDGTTRLGSHGS